VVTRRLVPWAWLGLALSCNSLLGNEDPTRIDSPNGGDAGSRNQAGTPNNEGGAPPGTGGKPGTGGAVPNPMGGQAGEAPTGGGEAGSGGAPVELPTGGAAGGVDIPGEAPQVTSVDPYDQQAGVEPTATITVTFSEPLDPETVTTETLTLYEGTTQVEVDIAYAGTSAVLTPRSPLSFETDYTVSATTAIKDQDGTPLSELSESTFTTRDGAFQPSEVVSNPTGDMILGLGIPPAPVVDAAGNGLVVWAQSKYGESALSIWGRSYTAGQGWGAAFEVDQTTTFCTEVTVAMNSAGDAVIVWVQDLSDDVAPDRRIYARRYGDGELQGIAQAIDYDPSKATAGNIAAAVTETGEYHVAWSVRPDAAPSLTYVYAAVADQGSGFVGAEDPLSTDWDNVIGPVLGFDDEGNGFAAWNGTKAGESAIYVRRYGHNTAWGAEIGISDSAGAGFSLPAIAVAPGGTALIAWTGEYESPGDTELLSSYFTAAQGWTVAELVEDGSGVVQSVNATATPLGFFAGWSQTVSPIENGFANLFNQNGWQGAELLSDGESRVVFDSSVAIGSDRRGNALATLIQQPETFGVHDVVFSRRTRAGDTWSAPRKVSGDPGPYLFNALGVSRGGTAIATWFEDREGAGALHATVFE
jgi:hypothetical protein